MGFTDKFKRKLSDAAPKPKLIVTKEIHDERRDICGSCDHLLRLTRQCKKCGCFVDAKAWLAGSSCPINKW